MEIMQNAAELARPDSTQQLDFYESMVHFKTMFPTMEEEIIEAVLRANNGAVDSTVDQLLNMSSDCTGSSESDLRMISSSDSDSSDDIINEADDIFTIKVTAPSPVSTSGGARPKQKQQYQQQPSPSRQIQDMFEPFESSFDHSPSKAYNGEYTNISHTGAIPKRVNNTTSSKRDTQRNNSNDYVNDLDYLPEIDEEEAPPIPVKPAYLRKSPNKNIMDASITDLVNLGIASDRSKTKTDFTPQGDYTNTLSVDQEDDIFVTPTNLHVPEVVAPDAPIAHDPRKLRASVAAKRPRAMSMPTFQHTHLSPVSLYKKYRPALLGDLPDDFLRLELSPRPNADTQQNKPANITTSKSDDPLMSHPRYHKRSASEQGHSIRYTPSYERHHHHVMGGWRRRHERPREATDLNSQWIAVKLQENERQRDACRLLGDNEAYQQQQQQQQQVLDDEYLALMLQNEEFLLELRQDSEFMSTLKTERRRHVQHVQPQIQSIIESKTEVESQPLPVSVVTEPETKSEPLQSELEREDTDTLPPLLEASEPAHASSDVTVKGAESAAISAVNSPRDANNELRKQLMHMGAASKKKLLAIARRFFALTKRTPSKPLYSQANTPSTMNLLLEEEVPFMDTLESYSEQDPY